jgi:hypothetical protein
VGLERDPLSLVSTTEELLERKCSGSGLETAIATVGDPPRDYSTPLYTQKLALTYPTSGSRSVGIILSRTNVTDLLFPLPIGKRAKWAPKPFWTTRRREDP